MILKKIVLCFITFYVFSIEAKSQLKYNVDSISVEKVQTTLEVNYLGCSIAQERKVKVLTTVKYGLGGHYSFFGTSIPLFGTRFINVIDDGFGREYYTSYFTPYVFLEGRKYFNLFKRAIKGKSILNNSGSYVSLFVEIPLYRKFLKETAHLELAYPLGGKLGIRRNLGKRIFFDMSGAIVGKISRSNTYFQPRFDFTFAFEL